MQITEQLSSKKSKGRNHSLQVDMTPMVDLGFLLITFFVFTSQISKPKALDLKMPKEEGESTKTKCSTSFTILADGKNIGWYSCKDGNPAGFNKSSVNTTEKLRQAIIEKRNGVAAIGKASDMVVMIKPLADADYKTLIDLLDEMSINGILRYAIVEPDSIDEKLMAE